MAADRSIKIRALCSGALDCPESERAEFLTRACGDDLELKSEVEKALAANQDDNPFLQNLAVAVTVPADPESSAEYPATSDSSLPRFEIGTLLNDRYEIVRLLGRGGMGEVYLASDTRFKRKVALKVLRSDLASSKEGLRRFALEAQAVSALNHPHIMTIHEFSDTAEGDLFFVAEYVDGKPLNHLIRTNLNLEKALDIGIQVSTALSAAHEAGITHRDIKPENIMVRRDGYVKVLDFGLVKLTQKPQANAGSEDPTEALHRTRPGVVMGTTAYMSPEQARGLPVDARTDLWSLGVVLYEMFTGRRPFAGETKSDLIVSVLSSDPPPLAADGLDFPAELKEIVAKALSKNVGDRYQTAKNLRADLEKIKKRIEFDEASRNDDLKEKDKTLATLAQATPTSANAAESTRGEQDDSTKPVSSSPSTGWVIRQIQDHKVRSSVFVLLLVALISSAAYLLFINLAGNRGIDSIAVLPFENRTGNSELAYISDGLSESVIDRLSELPQLKVISRNSSFKFRGSNIDLRDVASQLHVRAILTGSVTQVGDELVIRFDVVDAAEDRQITGGQYRRKAGDILRVQNEIAQTASEQLRLKLTDSQSKRLAEKGTENSEAYRSYLNGLVELNGPQFVQSRALEYFERAVTLDPDFAAAHAEIAWVYWSQANGSGNPQEIMPRARTAAERALAIDPNLAKAHVVMAMVKEYEFDWPGAESEYVRAIELSPNLDFARNNYAFFLSVMGRQDNALTELEQQEIRDPTNRRMILLQKGIILSQARKFDDALRTYEEARAVEPGKDVPNSSLGYVYAGKGSFSEAAVYYKKSVDLLGGEEKYSQSLVYLAATYAKMPEKRNEAGAILTRIEGMSGYTSPALLAAAYSALGDNDKAMRFLERASADRDPLLRFIKTGYEYDGLRRDQRFVDLTKRFGLGQ